MTVLRLQGGNYGRDFLSVGRTCSPVVLVAIALVACHISCCAVRAQEAATDSQRLILGFEKEELLKTEWVSREEKPGKSWFYFLDRPKGFDFVARFEAPGQINRAWTWV